MPALCAGTEGEVLDHVDLVLLAVVNDSCDVKSTRLTFGRNEVRQPPFRCEVEGKALIFYYFFFYFFKNLLV